MGYGRFAPNNRPKEGEYYYHIFIGCLFFLNTPRPFHEGIDVDRECIKRLEEEIFEVSERAGIAGNHQWGLDAGDNQYWNPYDGYWHTGEREEDEEETRVSLLYSKLYLKLFTGLSNRSDPITLKTLPSQLLKLNLALSRV